MRWFRQILCRHEYQALRCDAPGWQFKECRKCGRTVPTKRPMVIVEVSGAVEVKS